jgi:excisionase family DNA binding protein
MSDAAKLAFTVLCTAERLSISPRSVWRLIATGELKTVRCGRSVRVTAASLEAFISKGGSR